MNNETKYQEFLKKIEQIINNNDSNFCNESNHTEIDIFEKFNFTFQGKIKKFKKSTEPLKDGIKEITQDKELKQILKNIYNKDGSFQSIDKLLLNKEKIDINIINLVLSSKSYIKNLKIDKLEDNEIKYFAKILENLYNQNLNQLKKIKTQEKKSRKTKEKRINKSLKEINTLRSILMNVVLNKKRKSK